MRFLLVIATMLLGNTAFADHIHYIGIHPTPKGAGGGLCHIEGPHVHVYPADPIQYRDHHGRHFFVGDPVAFGYDGERFAYKGHHPIDVHLVVDDAREDVEYCYLDGPHYHAFAPPVDAEFEIVGGVYFFVGAPTKAYVSGRPTQIKVNAQYKRIAYARPVVAVTAPAGWIGARVEVVRPAISVDVVVPSVYIGFDAHARHRHKHHHHKHHRKHHRHHHDDDDD
jgi:hypothetical protein